ncbi:hypothetical protein [Vitiosangium sp. GDMCC 1.1324]|uniref:hypothetical protein n=1 Tax=Vitiosangium sp. (strain GDMCC 1.1324) TaxID=2138576 RepID=UPI000D3D0B77|nr:hypothetical protein [Vitiosangium sp. GDMCC 1.1324]PTL76013.1 hypothetical protein DAT35_51745 [Vitiosangium sp. GDMCC 1.1324]
MSFILYQARVRQSFHRLLTLGLPLALVFTWLSVDVSMLLYTKFNAPPLLLRPGDIFLIPLCLGMGTIGRDVSEGLLPVLLTRPMRRSSYVLSHWAALGTVASFWALLHLLLQWGLIQIATYQPPHSIELLYNALGRVSLCFGMAATLVCFSSRLPAFGNLVLWGVLYYLMDQVLPGFGQTPSILEFTFTARQYLKGLLLPELDFRRTFAATPISWFRLTTYASNVSLLLLLAIYVFNRREVSYASR